MPPGTPAAPLRLLLLEDSEAEILRLEQTLRQQGLDILLGRVDSEAALREALVATWHVVLADYLPGLGGLAALSLVKERAPDLPVILISGTAGDDELVAAMKAGASDYILKSNLSRLGPAIQREVQEAESARLRRAAERARREAEDRLGFILEHTTDVPYRLRFESMTYDYIGPGIERLTGYTPEEMNAWGFATRIVTTGRPPMGTRPGDKVAGSWTDYLFRTKSGELRWLADHSFPWRDEEGGLVGSVGVLHDITERKRTEIALREAEQRLLQQLLQSQRIESMGRLARGVAHDFNNLFGVISGYGELLRRRVASDPQLAQYVDDIVSASQRAAGLTRQLLAFSRKQVLQPRILDLNAVVGETAGMLGRLIGEDVQLVTVLDERLGPVRADPGQIGQVLMNLAVNARDAMPRGGRLTIETGNVLLDDEHSPQHPGVEAGRYVLLAVSDTGHGMTPEVQARAFEPFFTTKEPGKGAGLGLAIVYGIVKQSGGHIWVDSVPDQGTKVTICLPRMAETVLLVEDDASLRELMSECLETAGYAVLEAARGTAAVELCESHHAPIYLLITDVVMPGMSGRELATRLQASRSGIRVLYISGYTDDAVVIHGVLSADVAFLQKPFTNEELATKVREVLG